MSQYVDSSAYLKLYVSEPDGPEARSLLDEDPDWFTAAHTEIEVRRALSRAYRGQRLDSARRAFEAHWADTKIVDLDDSTCRRAAGIAEATGVKTLDALHLAAAGPPRPETRLVTFDRRMADTARTLGWAVAGA